MLSAGCEAADASGGSGKGRKGNAGGAGGGALRARFVHGRFACLSSVNAIQPEESASASEGVSGLAMFAEIQILS